MKNVLTVLICSKKNSLLVSWAPCRFIFSLMLTVPLFCSYYRLLNYLLSAQLTCPLFLCWFEMSHLSCTEYLYVHWIVLDFIFCSVNLFCAYAILYILLYLVWFYSNIFSILFLKISCPFFIWTFNQLIK